MDLSNAVLLRYPKEPWKPWFDEAGLPWNEPDKGPMYSDFGLLMDAAKLGHGVALGRSTIMGTALECGQLVKLFRIEVRPAFAYYIVYPSNIPLKPEAVAFIEWLGQAASEVQEDTALTVPGRRYGSDHEYTGHRLA